MVSVTCSSRLNNLNISELNSQNTVINFSTEFPTQRISYYTAQPLLIRTKRNIKPKENPRTPPPFNFALKICFKIHG